MMHLEIFWQILSETSTLLKGRGTFESSCVLSLEHTLKAALVSLCKFAAFVHVFCSRLPIKLSSRSSVRADQPTTANKLRPMADAKQAERYESGNHSSASWRGLPIRLQHQLWQLIDAIYEQQNRRAPQGSVDRANVKLNLGSYATSVFIDVFEGKREFPILVSECERLHKLFGLSAPTRSVLLPLEVCFFLVMLAIAERGCPDLWVAHNELCRWCSLAPSRLVSIR